MGLLSCAAALLQIHTVDTPPVINLLSWPYFKHCDSIVQNVYYKEIYALVVFKLPSAPSPLRQEEILRISRRGGCALLRLHPPLIVPPLPATTTATAAAEAVDKLGSIFLLHHLLPLSVAYELTASQV